MGCMRLDMPIWSCMRSALLLMSEEVRRSHWSLQSSSSPGLGIELLETLLFLSYAAFYVSGVISLQMDLYPQALLLSRI
jgi:hypothetical protein